jgi:hypothetical protein
MNKLKFKFGNGAFEFEVEGEDDFVKEKTEWAASLVSSAKDMILLSQPVQNTMSQFNNIEVAAKNYQSPIQFLADKKFSKDTDLTLGLAYYMEVYDKKEVWTTDDIKSEFSFAKKTLPSNVSQCIINNMNKSYIYNPNRDDTRTYCLTMEGRNYVTNYCGKDIETGTTKKTKKQTSKIIDPEEQQKIGEIKLGIEKYDATHIAILEVSKTQKDQTLLIAYIIYKAFGDGYEFTAKMISELAKKVGVSLDPIQTIKTISANAIYFDTTRRSWYTLNGVGVKFVQNNLLKTEE